MTFEPKPGASIDLNGEAIEFVPLEASGPASVFVYAEAGKEGTVYKVLKDQKYYALKVFYSDYQTEQLLKRTEILSQYKNLVGFQVAERTVINREMSPNLLHKFPELNYSVIMPWIYGTIWGNLMVNKCPLETDQYLQVARLLIKSIYVLEEHGLAHCDLSNNNFIINPSFSSIQLIDIENFYAPDMPRPVPNISYGTLGYRTKWIAENGLWGPNSDRFASAILCSEIISWHNKEIRDSRAGDTAFFDETEIGEKSERYQIMKSCLGKLNSDLPVLFEKAWFSENSDQCPSISDWRNAIDSKNNFAIKEGKDNSDFKQQSISNTKANLLIERVSMDQDDEFTNLKKGLPDVKTTNMPKVYLLTFFIISGLMLAFLLILLGLFVTFLVPISVSNSLVSMIEFFAEIGGAIVYTTLISFLVSIIQVYIFRNRIKTRRFIFLILSVMSGLAGGFMSGLLVYFFRQVTENNSNAIISLLWWIVGGVIGLITGAIIGTISSLLQNYIMKNSKYNLRWFLYNLVSWSFICSIGWALSLGLSYLIDFPFIGDSIASMFIMIAHGIGIIIFLNYSPQIEFS